MNTLEAELQTVVAELFQRMPMLVGFSLADADELCLAQVETFPWNPTESELVREIGMPLLELLDEEPEARALLRGRTFARAVH